MADQISLFDDDDAFARSLAQPLLTDIGPPIIQGSAPSQVPLSMAASDFHLNIAAQGPMDMLHTQGFPFVNLQQHLSPQRINHMRTLQPPQITSCQCRLPPTTQQEPEIETFSLSQAREDELFTLASRIFPFMNNGFRHEVLRDSNNQGESNGITHHWSLFCARVVATDHDMISVTSQPMNTVAAAFESLVNIMRNLKPVEVELTVQDTFQHDAGCCSRCRRYQEHRHPVEYSRYRVKVQKRFQPANR